MIDMFNMLGGMSGAQQQVSQQLGTDPAQTASALEAAVPLLLGAMTRNAQTPEGAAALGEALNDHSAETLGLFQQGQLPNPQEGQQILGHVFGNQQSSAVSAVAQRAGISPQLALQILSLVAPLVLSYLSHQRGQGQGGGLGGILGSVLGSGLNGGGLNGGGLNGGLGGILGSVLGNSGMGNPGLGNSGMGESGLGGPVLPGYPADQGGPDRYQTAPNQGGLVGTLENVLQGGGGSALEDLIGMFGGRRS